MVVVALIMISTLAALDAQGEAVAGRTARPVLAAVAGAAANSHEQPMLELRVVAHAALGKQNVEIARETAETLLATAGLNVEWRECGGDTCASPSEGRPSILVHLLPLAKRTNPMISGEVARDDTHTIPIVLVYVPRCDGVADRIRRSSGGRSHPALATVTTGHLVGLTIAHEVGHALGLPHDLSGPMKAELVPDDIIAFRSARLRFEPGEGDTMQRAVRPTPGSSWRNRGDGEKPPTSPSRQNRTFA